MAGLIIFDDGLGQFGPMTDLRAAFEVRTGMMTSAARLAACWPGTLAGYWTPEVLREIVAERVTVPVNSLPTRAAGEDPLLCVNGRWLLPQRDLRLVTGSAVVEEGSGHVVAALLSHADTQSFLKAGRLPHHVRSDSAPEGVLCRFPWQILANLSRTLAWDLAHTHILEASVPPAHSSQFGPHPVAIHSSAQICPGVVFDSQQGPIMVHERAIVRPGAVLCGPCSIGHDSTIIDRALIKAHTVIGPVCKIAGEVGGTIFQGFSNKAHDGHLGDSWVGKWVNFGAGTTNSNLLNTYGEVTMRLEPDGPRQRTGLQYLGAIVGDHAKFAICTRIMTGSCVGTGAMIATTTPPPTVVQRFAWLTDEGERTYKLDKFLEVMTTVMARRKETPGPAYLAAVKALHERAVDT